MIIGDLNEGVLFHVENLFSSADKRWEYGACNFIIDGQFYPGYGTNWTINFIIKDLKSSFQNKDEILYLKDCENTSAEYLFREAVVSRIGYFYDAPNNILSSEEKQKLYPNKLGGELNLSELEDCGEYGFSAYLFRGDTHDILVYSFNNIIKMKKLTIGYMERLLNSL